MTPPAQSIDFEIPLAFKPYNILRGMHFAEYRVYRNMLAHEIAHAARKLRPASPFRFSTIIVTRYSPKIPDKDGLYGGVKPLIDCLCPLSSSHPNGMGFIEDDNPISLNQIVHPYLIDREDRPRTTIQITPHTIDDPTFLERLRDMNVPVDMIHKWERNRQNTPHPTQREKQSKPKSKPKPSLLDAYPDHIRKQIEKQLS